MTDHAVFIGSSNGSAGYGWTQALSARRGWEWHNYSIGGGAFAPLDGVNNFKQQALTAAADDSYDHGDVSHVFVTDMSNDIRGRNNVEASAGAVFSILRCEFPNARIIVIPAVWTYVRDNHNELDKRLGVRRRYVEARRAGIEYGVEVIPESWLWFWDDGDWLEAIEPNFHLNPAGYRRLTWYVGEYLDGRDVDNPIGWAQCGQAIPGDRASTLITVSRDHGWVSVNGRITTYADVPIDTPLAFLPAGTAPVRQMVVEITDSNRARQALYVNDDSSGGSIVTMTPLPWGKTFWVQAAYLTL